MKLSAKEFEYQFRCLYRPLNMYALRYTENLDDAEDIVQIGRASCRERV